MEHNIRLFRLHGYGTAVFVKTKHTIKIDNKNKKRLNKYKYVYLLYYINILEKLIYKIFNKQKLYLILNIII